MKKIRILKLDTRIIRRNNWWEDSCLKDYHYWISVGLTLTVKDGFNESMQLYRKYVKRKYQD